MARGNKRDVDRERAQKRTEKNAKDKAGGKNLIQKLSDAEIMRDKQKKAEEKK